MYPLVLVKSFGQETSSNIIKDLLRANEDSNELVTLAIDSCLLETYKLSISTKYYKTQVFLFECEDLTTISKAVKNSIEGSIFYFDPDDIKFLDEIKTLVKFVKDNKIELPILISRSLNTENKISYDDIMKRCKLNMSIIDLNESFDTNGICGYKEVLEFLKNNVWSTVEILKNNILDEDTDMSAEGALNEFEDLLNKFQQFKDVSRTLSREEVLKNAENLAELFEKILNED